VTTSFLAMLKDDEGATLVEYGLVVSLIAVAAIIAVTAVGTSIKSTFTHISTTLDANHGT
jgi:pilus assembly protein Flp/PilA